MGFALLILLFGALAVLVWRATQKQAAALKPTNQSAAVHQQHVYLYQGGQLSESELESARVAIQMALDAESTVTLTERGLGFAVQVQALTQIGTRGAIGILQEQLRRTITSNPHEQAWYWLDITRALRQLDQNECLPLLFAPVAKSPAPLDRILAAEAVCFPGFIDLLQSGDATSRQGAARLLHLALVGLRSGVHPHVVVSGRLGKTLTALWECRWDEIDPAAVRVFHEALRLLQRAGHWERLLADDEIREKYQEEIQLIDLLAEPLADWLHDARIALPERLKFAPAEEQADLLRAAIDLRADTAAIVRPMLEVNQLEAIELAIESLAFSKQAGIGDWLCQWTRGRGIFGEWRLCRNSDRRGKAVNLAVLRTLRYLPCQSAERYLVNAASNQDDSVRTAALGSLGWWEPLNTGAVLRCLHDGRFSRSLTVQTAAQAALARLGERLALQWFRRQMAADSNDRVHQVLDRIAQEGIVLLWPDLDHLVDAEDSDIAHHACETLELLREDFSFSASLH
jgi:hypothetical protein